MKINILTTIFSLFFYSAIYSQKNIVSWKSDDIFQTNYFIENNGQFLKLQDHLTNVDFSLQNNQDEIYLYKSGYSLKVSKKVRSKKFGFKNSKKNEKELEHPAYEIKSGWFDLEWQNTNKNVEIIKEKQSKHYLTYGEEKFNSFGFEKITYKNIYDKIDIVYEVSQKGGMKYSFVLHPGSDIKKIKANVKSKKLSIENKNNSLIFSNFYKKVFEKDIKSFYENGKNMNIEYGVDNNIISFINSEAIDTSKTLIIDPWVGTTNSLVGLNLANQAGYDIDYDAQGNLFVFGGGGALGTGNDAFPKVAKYDVLGNLLWTFSGQVVTPAWNSSPGSPAFFYERAGNFVVNKQNSKCYISQGLNVGGGAIIVRLNAAGAYDNFITTANTNFEEIWELKINCATERVIGFGGGTTSNINFGIVDTTTGVVTSSNVTGSANSSEDAVNAALAPNGEAYVLFVNTFPDIFKLNSTYTSSLWNISSGMTAFNEQGNKPYTNISAFSNGYNCLAANQNYLFVYDGSELKCFSAVNGTQVGTTVNIGFNQLLAGGIATNECNEVFIGKENGSIDKYLFNGTNFSLVTNIPIPNQSANKVHDIIYNSVNNLLYVCGDNFVATVDPIGLCNNSTSANIQLSAQINCPDSVTITVLNPNAGVNYNVVLVDTNSGTVVQNLQLGTGVTTCGFNNLLNGVVYKVTFIQSSACQILSGSTIFTLNCSDTTIYLCNGKYYTLSNGSHITTPGSYKDTLKNQQNQDSIITITLINYPTYNNVINASICPGQTYTLPSGSIVNTSGTYTSNFNTIHGCDSIIKTILNVVEIPNAFLGNDTTICIGDSLKLNASINIPSATYLWNDNTTNPIKYVKNDGTYQVTITVAPCPSIQDDITLATKDCSCSIFIPNAFTPNADGINNIFKPSFLCEKPIQNFMMSIYNRWGQKVFESDKYDFGWNGTYNSDNQEIGTYMYMIEFFNVRLNKKEFYKGDFILIR